MRNRRSQFSAISMVFPRFSSTFGPFRSTFCHFPSVLVTFNQLQSVWPNQKTQEFRRRTNVQQLTCNIDLSCSFYYLFFSFVLLGLKPCVLKGKVLGENFGQKSVKNSETILPFSCCPLIFLWKLIDTGRWGKQPLFPLFTSQEAPESPLPGQTFRFFVFSVFCGHWWDKVQSCEARESGPWGEAP